MQILLEETVLNGDLTVPQGATTLVVFVHGSGSSRLSPRNRHVAKQLNERGLATFLFDLLTEEEETVDMITTELRFNIPFLADRLYHVVEWIMQNPELKWMKLCFFGSSTGAAAALEAAAKLGTAVEAVVSRGGRPDLAIPHLPKVTANTLFIVGGDDVQVLELNKVAFDHLRCKKKLTVIPGATHLFEEEGALDKVVEAAGNWFSNL